MTDDARVQPASADARCHLLLAYLALAGLVLLLMHPVLSNGHFHMLDSAGIYSGCSTASIFRPSSFICLMGISNQARPGQFLMYLPGFVARSARLHYWFQSGLVLYLTLAGIMFLVHRVTGRILLAFAGAAACMFTASFVENFFTLFKCEIFMQFGVVCIMCALWLMLFEPAAFRGRTALIRVLGVVGAIYSLTVKETAGTFLMVLLFGLPPLLCARSAGMRAGIRRVAWLIGVTLAAFAVLVLRFLTLPSCYTQGGTASYSLDPKQLHAGIVTLWNYLGATASYVLPAGIAAVLGIALLFHRFRPIQAPHRIAIAWTLFAWLWFASTVAAYVPWSGFQVRYMLVTNTSALLATVLSVHLVLLAVAGAGRASRAAAWSLAGVTGLLVLAHSVFTLLVGHLSEARIRCGVDQVDHAVVSCVTAGTCTGGTAYFLMDTTQPEPMVEMQLRMGIFYHRPDILCAYPLQPQDMHEPGLVCVPEGNICYNPNRIPVHYSGEVRYRTQFATTLAATPVTNVSRDMTVWYTDPNALRGFQHSARYGIPAFWRLKRGQYHFAWNILRHGGDGCTNLVLNGSFTRGMKDWALWWPTGSYTSLVNVGSACVRITDPDGSLEGVRQNLSVLAHSGQVFRLSAWARTVGRPSPDQNTGARVAFHLPQHEQDIIWLSQMDAWIQRTIVFTNMAEGTPSILAHMGYGKVKGATDITDIRLELIGQAGNQ